MKTKSLLLSMLFLAVAHWGISQNISTSAHNFSSETWSGGQICIACHTPHNGSTTPGQPLWNHNTTTATFTLYSSTTLNATMGQPSASSKLCLSCHDGTVPLDAFGGSAGSTYMPAGATNLGTNLANEHPVSFNYDAALVTADGGLKDPLTTSSGLGGSIDSKMLFNHKMECASCHDVHNSAGVPKLLVKTNAGSALCLTCHAK